MILIAPWILLSVYSLFPVFLAFVAAVAGACLHALSQAKSTSPQLLKVLGHKGSHLHFPEDCHGLMGTV